MHRRVLSLGWLGDACVLPVPPSPRYVDRIQGSWARTSIACNGSPRVGRLAWTSPMTANGPQADAFTVFRADSRERARAREPPVLAVVVSIGAAGRGPDRTRFQS